MRSQRSLFQEAHSKTGGQIFKRSHLKSKLIKQCCIQQENAFVTTDIRYKHIFVKL